MGREFWGLAASVSDGGACRKPETLLQTWMYYAVRNDNLDRGKPMPFNIVVVHRVAQAFA